MEILGIDAATKKTGYSIIDSESGDLVNYGLIKTSSVDVRDRMEEIYSELKKIINNHDNIKVVVVEDVPVNTHSNIKTGKDLSILQGVILGVCFEQCLPCIIYAPSGWRSRVGLYNGTRARMRRAIQKELAVDKVNKLYNLNFSYYERDTKTKQSDDDIAEAILIARAFFMEQNENKEE